MEEQEIHLRDYLRVIQKRKSIIATFFLITFIVVVIGTFSATPIYEASTQILVEKSDNTPLTGSYYRNFRDPEFFETQRQIIRSQNVAKKVVDILSLDTNYETYFPAEKNKPSIVRTTVASIKSFVADLLPSTDSADKAWEKSKGDPEIHNFVKYLVNWVAGTKLIFILLLIVILYIADEQTLVLTSAALVISITSFFWRLFPLIRRMDHDGQIDPKNYSAVLGWMIFAFILVFLTAIIFSVFR